MQACRQVDGSVYTVYGYAVMTIVLIAMNLCHRVRAILYLSMTRGTLCVDDVAIIVNIVCCWFRIRCLADAYQWMNVCMQCMGLMTVTIIVITVAVPM